MPPNPPELPSEPAVEKANSSKLASEHPYLLAPFFREWSVLRKAPYAFGSIAVCCLCIGGLLVFWLFNIFIIPGKDGTIQQQNATIAGLTQQLESKPESAIPVDQTPEFKDLKSELEAQKTEFENLKAHSILSQSYVDPDEWPALTDEQIGAWTKTLEPYHLKSITVIWGPEVEARNLFKSLEKIGKKLNCPVSTQGGDEGGSGIIISALHDDPAAPVIKNLFGTFNCSVDIQYNVNAPPSNFGAFDIYIGERPASVSPSSSPTNSVSPSQ